MVSVSKNGFRGTGSLPLKFSVKKYDPPASIQEDDTEIIDNLSGSHTTCGNSPETMACCSQCVIGLEMAPAHSELGRLNSIAAVESADQLHEWC